MANKYAQLHQYLLSAMDDFKSMCERNNERDGQISINLRFDRYDEAGEIKYTVSEKYGSGPSGNELGPVMEEFFRRKGWDTANNTKLIT